MKRRQVSSNTNTAVTTLSMFQIPNAWEPRNF